MLSRTRFAYSGSCYLEEEEEKEGKDIEKLRQDVTILPAANRFGLVALSSETNRSHSSCPGDGSISMTEGSNVDYMHEVRTLEKVEVAVEEGEEKEKVLDKHGRTPTIKDTKIWLDLFRRNFHLYYLPYFEHDAPKYSGCLLCMIVIVIVMMINYTSIK